MANRKESYTIRLAVEGGKVVSGEFGQIASDGEKAFKRIDSSGKLLSRTFENMGQFMVTRLIPAFAGLSAGRSILDNIQTFEKLDKKLQGLSKSTQDYAGIQDYLRNKSEELHVGIEVLAESYSSLLALEKNGLLDRSKVDALTEGFVNIKAALGVDDNKISNVLYGLSQALGSGVVRAEEFNQVIEPIPSLLGDMERAAGLSSGTLRQMVNDGEVTSEMFGDILVKALAEYEGKAAGMAGTSVAAFTDLNNAWVDLSRAIGESGIVDGIAAGTEALADFVRMLTQAIQSTDDLIIKLEKMTGLWGATKELAQKSGFNYFADSMVASGLKLGGKVGLLDSRVGDAAYDDFFNGNLDKYRKEKAEKATALIKQTRDSVNKVGSVNTGKKFGPLLPGVQGPDAGFYAKAQRADRDKAEKENDRVRTQSAKEADRIAEQETKRIAEVIESLKFEAEQLQRTEKEQMLYNQLKAAGVEANSAAGQEIAVLVEKHYALEQAQKRVADSQEDLQEASSDAIQKYTHDFEAFNNITEKAMRGQIKSWRDLGQVVIEELQNILIAQTRLSMAGGKSGGGVGGLLGSLFSGVAGMFGGGLSSGALDLASQGSLFSMGFATGGAFTVGGDGGTDTTPVSFMATRGERVTVETPEQQKRSGGGGTYFIDARGADNAGLARLEAMIVKLNGSIEHRSVAAVQDKFNRNPRFMR